MIVNASVEQLLAVHCQLREVVLLTPSPEISGFGTIGILSTRNAHCGRVQLDIVLVNK